MHHTDQKYIREHANRNSVRQMRASLGPLHLLTIARRPNNVIVDRVDRVVHTVLLADALAHPGRFLNHHLIGRRLVERVGNVIGPQRRHSEAGPQFGYADRPATLAAPLKMTTHQKYWSPNHGLMSVGIPARRLAPTVPAPPWCKAAWTDDQHNAGR